MTSSPAYARSPSVLWRRAGDGLVLLSANAAADATPIFVTAPGPLIWDQLELPITLDALADHLASIFGVPAETVMPDLVSFVDRFSNEGLVVRSDVPNRS